MQGDIDASYRVSSLDLMLTTISLVQGDCSRRRHGKTRPGGEPGGGGRGVQMGLPEVLFNLFPGMGAYSFLSRRLGANEAERVILSGKDLAGRRTARTGRDRYPGRAGRR